MDGSDGRLSRQARIRLVMIVAAAFALRMVVVALIFRDFSDPARHYDTFGNEVGWVARSIAWNHGFSSPFYLLSGPTALLPPLYPYLLSVIFRVFGVYSATSALTMLTLNSLFSSLTCVPIYLATRLSLNARVAMFAGWGWAIYPFAIYFSAGRVWEYSLTSLLLTTCFWLALRLHQHRPARWLGYGALYGFTGLSNPAILSLCPVLITASVVEAVEAASRGHLVFQRRAAQRPVCSGGNHCCADAMDASATTAPCTLCARCVTDSGTSSGRRTTATVPTPRLPRPTPPATPTRCISTDRRVRLPTSPASAPW